MNKKHFSRRSFLQNTARAAMLISTADLAKIGAENADQEIPADGAAGQQLPASPWYRTVTRWGQVNITEKDPPQYDIPW